MFPKLYPKTVYDPVDDGEGNGYGILSDCIECKISETLNGEYKLDMLYPLGGIHYEEIAEGAIIYAKRDNLDNWQLFRIAEVDVDYITRQMTIYAPHISRDLENVAFQLGTDKQPGTTWIDRLNNSAFYKTSKEFLFAYASDVPTLTRTKKWTYTLGQNLLDFLLSACLYMDGTTRKFELEFDNHKVTVHRRRGTDTNFQVRYGKNLTSLTSKDLTEHKYYGCIPVYKYNRTIPMVGDAEFQIFGNFTTAADFNQNDPTKRAYTVVEFSNEQVTDAGATWDESDGISAEEENAIKTALNSLARDWNAEQKENRERFAGVTIDFDYLDLAKAAQYWTGPKPEEVNADIGDTITVFYGGNETRTEITSIVYDCLKERYEQITAGQLRPTLAKTIKLIARRG